MGTGGSGGRFELSVRPGQWYYRFALEAGTAGMVTPRDSIVIPDLGRPLLAISGIGLGEARSHIRWAATPADTAILSPHREYAPESEMQLYYEIYGLAPRAPFQASVIVSDRRGSRVGRSRLKFTFTEESQGDITRIRRALRLVGLRHGEYWLEVAVKGQDGQQVHTSKSFTINTVAQ